MREFITGFLYAVFINRHLKYFIFEKTKKANLKPLFMRGFFGTLNSFFGVQNT